MKQDKDHKPDSPSLAAERIRELNLGHSLYAQQAKRASIKYERSLRQGLLPTRYDSDIEAQVENYREFCMEEAMLADRLTQAMERAGASPFQRIHYLNFARHIGRLCRDYSSIALRNKVREAVVRWTARGLDPAALRAVLNELYGLSLSEER
jgi:hypothetical protein